MNLSEELDAIDHDRMRLQETDRRDVDANPHKPDLSLWAGHDDDTDEAHIVLLVDAAWGQPARFLELTIDQARALSMRLRRMADRVEATVSEHAA